jgi:hypothetical protein
MLLPLLLIAAPAVGAEAPPALITFNKPQPCNERQSGEKEIVVCGAMHTESPYLFCFPTLSGSRAMRIARGAEQLAAKDAASSPCSTVGPNQRCNRGLSLIRPCF